MAEKAAAAETEEPRSEIRLVRLGHYFTPTTPVGADLEGTCETALICDVQENEEGETVTVSIWSKIALPEPRSFVQVAEPGAERASFHLSKDCPWSR